MKTKTLRQTSLFNELDDIVSEISWGEIAEYYFPDKSVTWFYNKLRGVDGNGGKGEFTLGEKIQLRNALFDFSERVRKAAENITI
ncbi:MAG: DUF5053 domain-containing protein [Bacteroidetes bacterium]|nr:DUF5053 domain-containing protein [Bacteroidota bacterium]